MLQSHTVDLKESSLLQLKITHQTLRTLPWCLLLASKLYIECHLSNLFRKSQEPQVTNPRTSRRRELVSLVPNINTLLSVLSWDPVLGHDFGRLSHSQGVVCTLEWRHVWINVYFWCWTWTVTFHTNTQVSSYTFVSFYLNGAFKKKKSRFVSSF